MPPVNIKTIYIIVCVLLVLMALMKAIIEALEPPKKRRKPVKTAKKTIQKSAPRTPITLKNLTDEQILKANIDRLSGTDFERLMELYYTDKGYKVQRVGGAGDHEVDLILQGKEGYKIAVQCKRWKNDVGNDIVLRLKSGKQVHGCYDAWIVTTSHFTPKAKEAAERLNIRLINGLMLQTMISDWKKKRK